ncbi:PhnD/SsuA/transferrin family substrate-binding protein [Spiroplasma chinense]|uniref:PhnD/SsuA/transferrin family substrate-binding protein n=1 Tax=Spiroplasma chinense TaxID=216932 RepID=A0A5B9Y651_9MOLU|nr:PhnD/SsuA/transferrin family substrate-binding protein [Spiroplasma chinense]QEH61522.1 PhnD/SsuA/transferrin family substrate-binding protein [Spiroplasma chinense]
MKKVKVGAVVYAPQVTVVWEIICKFFKENNILLEMEYFADYKTQVQYLLQNKIDIAWNSPLAHVLSKRGSNKVGFSCMRDTDQNRKSVVLSLKDSNIVEVKDLKGKKIGFGALDSPQARLIPIWTLKQSGLEHNQDYEEVLFNIGVGLHGDHVGGEEDALKSLVNKEIDASVTTEGNFENWITDGTFDKDKFNVVHRTGLYDHCIFTTREGFDQELKSEWEKVLYLMDYSNPEHKEMMDLEGLKKWVAGREEYFEQLENAIDYLGYSE